MKASKIQIDHEYEDDGLFAITFYFKEGIVPYYVTLARDESEEPDEIYFEAEDQIHSFKSKNIRYSIAGNTINFDLTDDHFNSFFWNNSDFLEITVPEKIQDARICLERIFEIGRKSNF